MKKLVILIVLFCSITATFISCTDTNPVLDEQLTDPNDSTNPNTPPPDDPDNGEG